MNYIISASVAPNDPVTSYWYLEKATLGSKPPPRYRHSAARIGRSIFVFGGINTNQKK